MCIRDRTYPLPEAQRDRFLLRISMGYPSEEAELAMLDHHGEHDPLEPLRPVTDAAAVLRGIAAVRKVYVHPGVKAYLVAVSYTHLDVYKRQHPHRLAALRQVLHRSPEHPSRHRRRYQVRTVRRTVPVRIGSRHPGRGRLRRRRPRRFSPVSYTHLDVYKRQ